MRVNRDWIWILCFFVLTLLFQACAANKKMNVMAVASLLEEVAKSSYKQSDLRLIREGTPAYLMLMDGMVEAWPENERLLLAAAQGYASYAATFLEDQDKAYAKALYGKAKDYALRSLAKRGFENPINRSFDDFKTGLKHLKKDDVPYLFWAAANWGNWIGLNLNSMEAMAELPRVELMMRRALALDEGFYYGGPHLFMGIWYASRPRMGGGDLDSAQRHFQKAIKLGEGKFLMTYVYYAYYYARKIFDKDLFASILHQVLNTPADTAPDLTLLNTVAHQKAKKMLRNLEGYF